jgi:hypothetical protein
MDYLVFDKEKKQLYYRENFTSNVDRITLSVKMFSIVENRYVFDIDEHHKLKIKQVFFPINNTVLSII